MIVLLLLFGGPVYYDYHEFGASTCSRQWAGDIHGANPGQATGLEEGRLS